VIEGYARRGGTGSRLRSVKQIRVAMLQGFMCFSTHSWALSPLPVFCWL
jgi:hypothetical protein